MRCARCGTPVPDGSRACPSCGAELSFAPPPAEVWQSSSSLGQTPQDGPQGGYVSPGDAHQRFSYPEGPPPPYMTQPGEAPGVKKGGAGKWLLILLILMTLAGGAFAAVYFLVLNDETEATGPQATVLKYYDALSSGDSGTLKSLYAPEAMPPQVTFDLIAQLFGSGTVKYTDIELKTVSESPTDAEIQVVSGKETVSFGGRSVSNSIGGANTQSTFKLKQVGGSWLIYQDPGRITNFDIPEIPGEVPAAPSRDT